MKYVSKSQFVQRKPPVFFMAATFICKTLGMHKTTQLLKEASLNKRGCSKVS